jgi:hypothetical protein
MRFWILGSQFCMISLLNRQSAIILRVDPEYIRSWNAYRKLRAIVASLFLLAMVEVPLTFFIPGMIFAMTFLAYFFTAAWLACWTCPRCGQPFFRFAFYRSLFGGKCFHCDLPKWGACDSGKILYEPRFCRSAHVVRRD